MISLFRTVLIVAAFSSPAFADYLTIVPAGPHSEDAVVAEFGGLWRDTCLPIDPTVSRSGNIISVLMRQQASGCNVSRGRQWEERVTLGTLEPGLYLLNVIIPFDPSPAPAVRTLIFPVTDAGNHFTITPDVDSVEGGTEVRVEGPFNSCPIAPPCPETQLFFGGVPAQVRVDGKGRRTYLTPPHAAGVVDVEIRGTTFATLTAAFTYHDDGIPDPAASTPVLVPLIFSGPGAFGGQFVTEATAFNKSLFPIKPRNDDAITNCYPSVGPCSTPPFGPEAWTSFHHGEPWPAGLILWMPRSQADNLHYSLHVRDVSRTAEGAGTAIPVVREEDLLDEVHLLNVPVTEGFRHTIRIYDLGFTSSRQVNVRAFSSTGQFLGLDTLTLTAADESCEGCTPSLPRFVISSDFVAPAEGLETMRLEITPVFPGMRLWAFVSVTNNATQQITTVTPE